jgi:DNA-binding transcriptional LysR family regulator
VKHRAKNADLVAQPFMDNPLVIIAAPTHALAAAEGPIRMARHAHMPSVAGL